jgi:hypothetical protein
MARRLIQEYIRGVLLTEDLDVGITHDLIGGWGSATGGDLAKTFLTPFTDVIKTAGTEAKELAQRGGTFLKVLLNAAISIVVPFLDAEYKEIFAAEERAISAIRASNKDVYDRTFKALKGDAAALAFFAAPQAFIAANAMKMGPGVGAELLSIASGGFTDKYFQSVMKESADDQAAKEALEKALNDPEVKKAINSNSQKLQKIADGILNALTVKADAMATKTKEVMSPGGIQRLKKLVEESLPNLKLSQGSDQQKTDPNQQISDDDFAKGVLASVRSRVNAAKSELVNMSKELSGVEASSLKKKIEELQKKYDGIAAPVPEVEPTVALREYVELFVDLTKKR